MKKRWIQWILQRVAETIAVTIVVTIIWICIWARQVSCPMWVWSMFHHHEWKKNNDDNLWDSGEKVKKRVKKVNPETGEPVKVKKKKKKVD